MSTRYYNENGLLTKSEDYNKVNSIKYWNSSVEGIRAREDKNERIGYLTVAGKTIGDLTIDSDKQSLNIYGGFIPAGSQIKSWGGFAGIFGKQQQRYNSFQRAPGDVADGTLPEAPQDNLGCYTLQAGDTLERIAQQVYGDSSLWYLIADANGITDRKATAGPNGLMHIGQRLNIPPAAIGQHQTNATHRVLGANHMIGDTSATAANPVPIPLPTPKPKHHNKIWAKIVTAVVAVVATVLTAGILSGAALGFNTLMTAGFTALAGGAGAGLGTTLAIGFTAGFVGSMASQGAANALGLQQGIDFNDALINGIAVAATAGMGSALNGSLGSATQKLEELAINKGFSITNAALSMEQNALSQGLNVTLSKSLNKYDFNSGLFKQEVEGITSSGIHSLATGTHFDAANVLIDNFGSAVGHMVGNVSEIVSNIGSGIKHSIENAFTSQQEPAPLYEKAPVNTLENLSFADELEEANADYDNFAASQLRRGNNHEKENLSTPDLDVTKSLNNKQMSSSKNKTVKTNFDLLIDRLFVDEGGISNHRNDLGGYTNKGITIETFKSYAKIDLGIEPTRVNLSKITKDQAAIIYKKRFWDPIRADEINSFSIGYALFDFHVNAPGHAVELMQRSINDLGGKLKIDNKIGPKTLEAINNLDKQQLFNTYKSTRINYYIDRVRIKPDQKVFLEGWLNRVNNIKFER